MLYFIYLGGKEMSFKSHKKKLITLTVAVSFAALTQLTAFAEVVGKGVDPSP